MSKHQLISLLITDLGCHVTIVRRYFRPCDDPRATANSGGSRPSDNGVGGRGERSSSPSDAGDSSLKKIFSTIRASVWSKNKWGSRGPGSLPWIRQWLRSFPYESEQMSAGQSKNEMSSQSKLQINKRGADGMQQPSTYLKPTSFPGPLPLPFFNG